MAPIQTEAENADLDRLNKHDALVAALDYRRRLRALLTRRFR